jgi:hypothetical protein
LVQRQAGRSITSPVASRPCLWPGQITVDAVLENQSSLLAPVGHRFESSEDGWGNFNARASSHCAALARIREERGERKLECIACEPTQKKEVCPKYP